MNKNERPTGQPIESEVHRDAAESIAVLVHAEARPILGPSHKKPPFESLDGVHITCVVAWSGQIVTTPIEDFDLSALAEKVARIAWETHASWVPKYLDAYGFPADEMEAITSSARGQLPALFYESLRGDLGGVCDQFPDLRGVLLAAPSPTQAPESR